jgi:hypothetical protein
MMGLFLMDTAPQVKESFPQACRLQASPASITAADREAVLDLNEYGNLGEFSLMLLKYRVRFLQRNS